MFVYSADLTLKFRGLRVREGLLLRGPAGWAEFSPFVEYDDAESSAWLTAAHEAAFEGFPAPVRSAIPVNVTVPATTPENAHRVVTQSGGCRTAKVKVAEPGQNIGHDIARLEAVRDAIGPDGKIRIDVNGKWDLESALRNIPLLAAAAGDLEYVEQPCATVAELAAVRRVVDVPIAADESIRKADDPYAVVRAEAADIMIVKVQPLGGVRRCLALAEELALPVVVSSAIESSVGLAAGIALAAALPQLPYACGLATSQLFVRDVVEDPLLPVGGMIPVRSPEPSTALLEELAAPADRSAWWIARARRIASDFDIELPAHTA